MIGDDHVDPELRRVAHHVVRANAGIDADDQFYAVGRGLFHHLAAHAVAVAQPVRNMKRRRAAQQIDPFFQNHHRAGAVDVVIAVKQNRFFLFNRPAQPRDRFRHRSEQTRIVQVFERGPKETPRRAGIP